METTVADGPGPTIDNDVSKPEIAFILGGPGAGKGTQCARLAEDLKLVHISAGDLLRQQKDHEPPEIKEQIERAMREGKLVPPSLIMPILKKEFEKYGAVGGDTKILLDGFPRDVEQASAFSEEFTDCSLVLYFNCSKETMLDRVRRRAESSGRIDDNDATFDRRMFGYWNETEPLVRILEKIFGDRFLEIDAEVPLKEGYDSLKERLVKLGFAC